MTKSNKKSAKEASKIFHDIMKASVMNNRNLISDSRNKTLNAYSEFLKALHEAKTHGNKEPYRSKFETAEKTWRKYHDEYEAVLIKVAQDSRP